MAADASPPAIIGGSLTTCLIQHYFDLDEALSSLPTDITRQVAESNSLVDGLPAAAVPSDGGDMCPICREGFSYEENAGGRGSGKRVPCGHVYHAACISSWLSNSGGGSCPLCRRNITAGPGQK